MSLETLQKITAQLENTEEKLRMFCHAQDCNCDSFFDCPQRSTICSKHLNNTTAYVWTIANLIAEIKWPLNNLIETFTEERFTDGDKDWKIKCVRDDLVTIRSRFIGLDSFLRLSRMPTEGLNTHFRSVEEALSKIGTCLFMLEKTLKKD
jgi:hypothetical protein